MDYYDQSTDLDQESTYYGVTDWPFPGGTLPDPNADPYEPPVDQSCPEGHRWNQIWGYCEPGDPNEPQEPLGPGVLPDPNDPNFVGPINVPKYPEGTEFPPGTLPLPDLGDQDPSYRTELPTPSPLELTESPNWMHSPTDLGGVSAVNPQADAFDYGAVGDFQDAAWQNSMRYLEPQMELQDERYAQELINKGIDPYSEAGQKAFRQKEMSQSDQMSKAAFDALGFGAGLQEQMFGQDAQRSQLAQALLQAQMGLSQRGHEFDTGTLLGADQQSFGQMLGLEGLNYRDYLTSVDQARYQDSLALALAGLAPGPSYGTLNTGLPGAEYAEYGQQADWYGDLYK